VRELKRLRRESEEREVMALEHAELQRRRSLTDAEREREDQELTAANAAAREAEDKPKYKFLQKYYHKGAFYLDNDSLQKDDVRTKDYSAPTLTDNIDMEKLPAVLQVKNFGKRGRTKYTVSLHCILTTVPTLWLIILHVYIAFIGSRYYSEGQTACRLAS
jgi:microfibrillar-associated protein 1